MKLGLIGAGRIGKIHGQVIINSIPEAEIVMVSDVYLKGAEEWAAQVGIEKVTDDYNELLANPEIDAVLICSSTDTHADIIIASAQAGKNIFCEKPIDFNTDKIRLALDEVKKAGVKFQVGFNRRFDHNFAKVREAVTEGKIGDVHIVKVTSRDCSPPPVEYVKVSGGIFLDMMIHDFDMIRFLCGSEAEEVFAYGSVLVDEGIGKAGDVDTAIVTIKFKNGALGVIDNSREAVYGYDQRVEVFGNKGVVVAENDYPTNIKVVTKEASTSVTPLYSCFDRYADSYKVEIEEFVKAVAGNAEIPVVGYDGLASVLVALAAQKSLEENRPVKVSEIK